MPNAFWVFSIFGSLILLIYAIHQRDPVFILGQSFGMIVYFRNIALIINHKKMKDTLIILLLMIAHPTIHRKSAGTMQKNSIT